MGQHPASQAKRHPINDAFHHLARVVSNAAGSAIAFLMAAVVIITWAVTGPLFRFSDTWQLTMNTLASQVTPADLDQGSLFPPLASTREVSARIAVAVAEVAYQRGLAAKPRPDDLRALVQAHVYDPHYPSYA